MTAQKLNLPKNCIIKTNSRQHVSLVTHAAFSEPLYSVAPVTHSCDRNIYFLNMQYFIIYQNFRCRERVIK